MKCQDNIVTFERIRPHVLGHHKNDAQNDPKTKNFSMDNLILKNLHIFVL